MTEDAMRRHRAVRLLMQAALGLGTVTSASAQGTASTPWTLDGFNFRPSGYVKLDAIYDFDAIGSTDSFDPRTIPVDGSKGRNLRLHARQTRLGLEVSRDFETRPLRMLVEMDFFEGTSYALRLRHAYGEWGPWRAGQTWSLFVDEDALPSTLDFESPTSFPSTRQAQIRYTRELGKRWSSAVSAEDPSHRLELPAAAGAREERIAPDLIGRVKYKAGSAHAQVAGFVGGVRARFPDDRTLTKPIWGVMLGGRIQIGQRDSLLGQLSIGSGIGRFRGAVAGYLAADGSLKTTDITAAVAALDHTWSARVISTFTFGVARGDEEAAPALVDPTHRLYYASANVVYWWLPSRVSIGAEYLYGRRKTVADLAGSANRVQLAFKYITP